MRCLFKAMGQQVGKPGFGFEYFTRHAASYFPLPATNAPEISQPLRRGAPRAAATTNSATTPLWTHAASTTARPQPRYARSGATLSLMARRWLESQFLGRFYYVTFCVYWCETIRYIQLVHLSHQDQWWPTACNNRPHTNTLLTTPPFGLNTRLLVVAAHLNSPSLQPRHGTCSRQSIEQISSNDTYCHLRHASHSDNYLVWGRCDLFRAEAHAIQ